MPFPKGRPLTFRAKGCSDTFDGTNVFQGAMQALQNLIPAPQMQDGWVPRPASTQVTTFPGFTTPGNIEVMYDNGTRVYGIIQSARNSGKSEPFIYDFAINAFVTVSGVTAANTPTSTANTGDWTPPTADRVGSYIIFTHPGFDGTTHFFGWLDMSGFTSNTLTGNTHSNTTVDTLSANVITAGWRPGMTITDSAGDIPANTTIVSIAANGLSLVLSNAATGTNAGTTFTVAGGSNAAPLWASGNAVVNPLKAVPTAVAQYAGSACFAVNTVGPTSAAVVFSDSGSPLAVTNANQTVTFQNAIPVTALKGLPLNSPLTGGIIQSLLAFQGVAAIQQITGTPIASNLAVNALNDTTGTLAPNSIAVTPRGMLFAAPDGIRLIDFNAGIRPVVGRRGMGVSTPFVFALFPSRMCAAYNEGVYRITVQNGFVQNQPFQDWWLHIEDGSDGIWTGPHTFPSYMITATQSPHSFAIAPQGVTGQLWLSQVYTSLSATYIENGIQMVYLWQSCLLPDNAQSAMNAMIQGTLAISLPGGFPATVVAVDDLGNTLDTITIDATVPGSIWDVSLWDQAIWDEPATPYRQRVLNWTSPWNYKQAVIYVTGNCGYPLRIGDLYMVNLVLGYDRLEMFG